MGAALSGVRSELTALPGSRRTLAVTVPPDAVKAELDDALRRVGKGIKLPGFRKGKAPLAVVQRAYGGPARNEALQRVMEMAYRAALDERGLRPVSEGEIEGVDYRPESGLAFRISFDVRPDIELTRLDGLRVGLPAAVVEPGAVDDRLERLRAEHAIWRPADEDARPGPGDLVTVRIVPADGAESAALDVGLPWARRLQLAAGTEHRGRYQFEIGAGDAVPELEAAVKGLLPGQSTQWAPEPDRDGAAPRASPRLAVTLEDRQLKELPELDDLFAQSLGDFEDYAALRARIEADLGEEAARRAERVLETRMVDALMEANPFEVPASMVRRYLEAQPSVPGGGTDRTAPPGDRLAEAERVVKRLALLERVAERFGLEATPAEVDARLADLAGRAGVTPEQVRARLLRTDRMDRLVSDLTHAKVFDFLKGRFEIVHETPAEPTDEPREAP